VTITCYNDEGSIGERGAVHKDFQRKNIKNDQKKVFSYGALVSSSPPPNPSQNQKNFFSVQAFLEIGKYRGRMNATNNLRHIELDRLQPSRTPLRPVRKRDHEFVELMESIRTDGVLQPILVRPFRNEPDSYEVVEGNHRYAAAKLVGIETIPCMIKDLSDKDVLIIQLKAQAVRPRNTQKFEYARRLRKLLDDGMTVRGLAKVIDKSPQWIYNILSLNNLVDECRKKVEAGDVNLTSASALSRLPHHLQPLFLEDAIKMKAGPFIKRAAEAKRDYDTFLLEHRQGYQEEGFFPRVRPVIDIMNEAKTFEAAEQVLTSCNATTPALAWKACLAWIMRIDPVTVRKRKAGIKEKKSEYITSYEFRLKQRELIENLTFDTINYDGESNE